MSKEKSNQVNNLDSNQEEPVNTELANDYQPTDEEIIDDKLKEVVDTRALLDSYKSELKEISEMRRYGLLIANIGNKSEIRMRKDFDIDNVIQLYKDFLQDKIDECYDKLKDLLK